MTILYIPIISQWGERNSPGKQGWEQHAVATSKVRKLANQHIGLKNNQKELAEKHDPLVDNKQITATGTERTIYTMVRAGPI